MKFEDRAPEVEEVQLAPETPAVSVIDLQPFALDIAGAVDAAGEKETGAALAAVQAGSSPPEALLAWIDDLRDPEQRAPDDTPDDQQQGVVPDFLMDTQIADAIEIPPDPDDYFFSAVRRRRLDDEGLLPSSNPEPKTAADKDKAKSGS